jgi:hypothetical protein
VERRTALLQHPADDHDRVGTQDMQSKACAKFRQRLCTTEPAGVLCCHDGKHCKNVDCHFPWNSFVGGRKKYADVSSLSDALDREAHLVLIALAFSHEMLSSFSRKAGAVATKSLVPINAQVSTNRRALPDGRLLGSYPETAFDVGEMLNGACLCRRFDCHKNVVLIVMNRGKMRTKGEQRRRK